MFYFINRYVANKYLKTGIVIIIGSIGYLFDVYDVFLPFFLASAFSALPFFYIGYILKSTPLLYAGKNDRKFLGIGIICMILAVAYCCFIENPSIEFAYNDYTGNVVEIYLVAIAMVMGLLQICKYLRWVPIVSYIGRYSIIILGLHAVVMEYPKILIFHLTGHELDQMERLVLVLLICFVGVPLFRSLFPSLTAQSDLFPLPDRYKKGV